MSRDALEKIATRCAELSASQSGTEWLRGEIEKIGVMARDAAKPPRKTMWDRPECIRGMQEIGANIEEGKRMMIDDLLFGALIHVNGKRIDPADFFAITPPPVRLARFIEPVPASVTSSPRASKSDAVRQSPAGPKKSRRAKTK